MKMVALPKVQPESKLQTVTLNPYGQGVNLVLGFTDGHCNILNLHNQLDRDEVSMLFRSLSLDLSHFEIH